MFIGVITFHSNWRVHLRSLALIYHLSLCHDIDALFLLKCIIHQLKASCMILLARYVCSGYISMRAIFPALCAQSAVHHADSVCSWVVFPPCPQRAHKYILIGAHFTSVFMCSTRRWIFKRHKPTLRAACCILRIVIIRRFFFWVHTVTWSPKIV